MYAEYVIPGTSLGVCIGLYSMYSMYHDTTGIIPGTGVPMYLEIAVCCRIGCLVTSVAFRPEGLVREKIRSLYSENKRSFNERSPMIEAYYNRVL